MDIIKSEIQPEGNKAENLQEDIQSKRRKMNFVNGFKSQFGINLEKLLKDLKNEQREYQ